MGNHSILFLISVLALHYFAPADPPADLVKRVAQSEAATEAARNQYLYRQSVTIEEYDTRGHAMGNYREVREVIFTPAGERVEQFSEKPRSGLQRLILTDEDFQDIRNIQPLLLTTEMLPRYFIKFRGDERIDGVECWVLDIQPRQILQGMRLFEGLAWVEKESLAVIRTHGHAVPPIYANGRENLFPRFTTLREKIDGKYYFPVRTWADDILPFKTGPLRMKFDIRYTGYRRFGVESKLTFEK